jgi:hypothetical protein
MAQPELFSFAPDCLREKAPVPYEQNSVSDLSPELAAVLNFIPGTGISIEALAEVSGMDTAALASSLTLLEFKFLIRRGADMLYYRENRKNG